jgi:hypothetical protein
MKMGLQRCFRGRVVTANPRIDFLLLPCFGNLLNYYAYTSFWFTAFRVNPSRSCHATEEEGREEIMVVKGKVKKNQIKEQGEKIRRIRKLRRKVKMKKNKDGRINKMEIKVKLSL